MTNVQMDEFEKLLDETLSKTYTVADIVEGTVIKRENGGYLVSVKGAKTEAFLPDKEIGNLDENAEPLQIGDVREFYVLKEENDDDAMQLSLKRIAYAQAWAQLNDAKNVGDTILAKVVSIVKGGVLVDVADLKGFIPSSQLRTGTPFEGLVDTKIEVKVLEADKEDLAKEFMEKGAGKLFLPVDTVEANAFDNATDIKTVKSGAVDDGYQGLDIGAETVALFTKELEGAKTVFWNGPMGVFENPILAKGTIAVAQALADTDATTIIGGGDSAAAVNQLGFADKMTHISTGGGASLEFLEGKDLPGVVAANDK